MVLLVESRLRRKGGVYLAGEAVQCDVKITNNHSRPQIVAWSSAQIHCQEIVSSHRTHSRQSKRTLNNDATSFAPERDENGHSVYSSKPIILFCELELNPGENRSFFYTETLPPDDIPPSYKGPGVKYIYKLTIGVQSMNSTVKLMRIPFRVLVLAGFSHVCMDDNGLSPSNPFLSKGPDGRQSGILDIGNQVLENVAAVRNSRHNPQDSLISDVYNICNGDGRVARLSLPKNCFKLGEDVMGYFDFQDCPVSCYQYCVSLVAEEEISDEFKLKLDQKCETIVHAKQHAISICHKDGQIRLQIPLNGTPYFFTDMVHLRWKLHFEFVTSTTPIPEPVENEDGSHVWQAPDKIITQTMVWDLPIKVFPCNPLNACLGSFEIDKCATLQLKC